MKSFGLKFLLILALVCSSGVSEAKEKAKATAKKSDENVSVYQYLNVFSETFKRARTDYVEEVSEDKLIEYAINAFATSFP